MRKITRFQRGLGLGYFLIASPLALGAEAENPLFGYTHLLSSPLTLPAGRLVLGTDVAFGITDFLQTGTNVILDFYKVYNVHGKVAVLDFPNFALALTLGYVTYNYQDISSSNPDLRISSWLPGLVMGMELIPDLALFAGSNLNYTSSTLITEGLETSGYIRGAQLEADLSWAYNPKKKRVGNVLSSGVTYDVTYRIFGFGVSHHWPGFHLGIHYYPNATQYKVQPILAGGAAIDF